MLMFAFYFSESDLIKVVLILLSSSGEIRAEFSAVSELRLCKSKPLFN